MDSAWNSELNNNLYTFCEFLSKAYFKSLTKSNIVSGFKRTGVWNDALRGPDSSVLKDADFTANTSNRASDSFSLVESREGVEPIEHYRALINHLSSRARYLLLDGVVHDSGTIAITTKAGATLTSVNVLECLRSKQEKRRQKEQEKEERAERTVQRKTLQQREREEKARAAAGRVARQRDAEEAALRALAPARVARREAADLSRKARQQRAALRSAKLPHSVK
jgi:cell division protein ZapA (FtsZ GTPase activity inhibitor)